MDTQVASKAWEAGLTLPLRLDSQLGRRMYAWEEAVS